MMPNFICMTCATQYAESETAPETCLICADERQYIGHNGQQWTTLEAMRDGEYMSVIKDEEPNLVGIGIEPRFAIGQRALLVQTPHGNILWDCVPYLDDVTIQAVKVMGGLSAIAISHPHFYSGMVEWSKAFGNVPIYLHADDKQWVMRPDSAIQFWQGESFSVVEGVTLIRAGGHFAGSTVLHWADGANGKGVLLTADTIYVVSDRRYVSFMTSYPNLIPMSARKVRGIVQAVEPYAYDRIYSGWFGTVLKENAKAGVEYSAQRYIEAIE